MSNLYSYNGNVPSPLPGRIRLEDGSTITSLHELSVEKLSELGYFGPIEVPDYDSQQQKLVWGDLQYSVVNLTEDEIIDIKKSRVTNQNYINFWNTLITLPVYRKIRASASKDLGINVICLEFISNLNDAKNGIINVEAIQTSFNFIFLIFDFTAEEILQLSSVLVESGLDCFYSLPDETYLSNYQYDPDTNTIIEKITGSNEEFSTNNEQPYPSWTWNGTKWVSPVPLPSDATKDTDYTWDEQNQTWIKN